MHSFERKLITEWRRLDLPFRDQSIVVAVSGGADSMSLLLAIDELTRKKKLDVRVIVAHLNHSLRGKSSDEDAKLVREITRRSEFEFSGKTSRIDARGNLEENARRARYEFLQHVAEKYSSSFVLTAHTANDQAETLLLNLIRGSGVRGLSGMKSIRRFGIDGIAAQRKSKLNISIVRPLLSWAERADTENYCQYRKAKYSIDEMNSDSKFTRVRIRREVIPILHEINPQIVKTLSRTAEILGAIEPNGASDPGTEELRVSKLKLLDRSKRLQAIKDWLGIQRGDLRGVSSKHLDAIEKLVQSTKSGRLVQLPKPFAVIKQGGILRLTVIEVEKSDSEN